MSKPTKIEILKKRFEESKLQVKLFTKNVSIGNDDDDDDEDKIIEKNHLMVSIPEERDFKNIIIADDKEVLRLN